MTDQNVEKDDVVLVSSDGEGIGIHLSDADEHTPMLMQHFSELRKEPVRSSAIYGESLEHLLIQLEFLARLAGALDFVKKSLEANMPEGDAQLLENIEKSVIVVQDVIKEKFSPRLR